MGVNFYISNMGERHLKDFSVIFIEVSHYEPDEVLKTYFLITVENDKISFQHFSVENFNEIAKANNLFLNSSVADIILDSIALTSY